MAAQEQRNFCFFRDGGQIHICNWHEAVGDEPANGRPDGQIVAEFRRGYRLGARLVRAAMVKVAKA
jgi:hypothetical protein